MSRIAKLLLVLLLIGLAAGAAADPPKKEDVPPVPTPGMVTMVDLGARKCIPCKMMAPILEDLQNEYAGRASIVFIDVWEHREQARRFGIRSIPTQIFYDSSGKEVGRHVGFMDKNSITAILKQLGIDG